MKKQKLKRVLRTKRIWHLPVAILGSAALLVSTAMFLMYSMALPPAPVPSAWPSTGDWVKLTQGSVVITDREDRSVCDDITTGGSNPSQNMDDISSQAKCGSWKRYNPGLYNAQIGMGFAAFGAQQPNATTENTYSAAVFEDSENLFFRVRLAGDPLEHCHHCGPNFQSNYWYFILDIDNNGAPDFYVKLRGDGGGDPDDDYLQIIHEETGNNQINDDQCWKKPCDYFGQKFDDPLGNGWCRVTETPDNGTVGDSTQYFVDCQLPFSKFVDKPGNQLVSACDTILVDNITSSESGPNPYKKDKLVSGQTDPVDLCAPAQTADLSVTKTDGADSSVPGTQITYTIVVTNNGPDAVTGASVTDTFPGALSNISWTCVASAGTCAASGTGNISDTVDLPSGATATYTVTADINPGATGMLENTASVTEPQGTTDPDGENNTATDTNELTPSTDLAITKSGDLDPVMAGNNLTYTVTVTNYGPSDATGVTVIDTLPTGVTFVSATPTSGSCSELAGVVTCDLGSIASGSYENIMIIVNIPADTEDGTQLTNTASVTGNESDPDESNNSGEASTVTTLVSSGADLSVTKSDSPDPIRAGDELTYTVVVTNNGPSTSQNVVVTDMLPSNSNFVSAISDLGTCSEASGIVTCNLGDMDSGASANITIVLNPLTDGQTPGYVLVENMVSVTSSTSDPDSENNTASSTTTVTPNADLGIVKTDSPDPVYAGYELKYTLTISNYGPTAAENVTVEDTLPADVNFVSATADQGACLESGGSVICDLGTVNNGDNINIEISVIVSSGVEAQTILTNTAEVYVNDDCVPDPQNGTQELVAMLENGYEGPGCNPVDPNPENNTSSTETTVARSGGGGGGGGGGGTGGGEPPPVVTQELAPAAPEPEPVLEVEEQKYCLGYDENRSLAFLDMDQAALLSPYPVAEANVIDVQRAMEVIKDTYNSNVLMQTEATQVSDIFAFAGKQWVISGYPGRDATGVPVTKGTTGFIGPFANTTRLELAKVLLISHCYPIMNSLELTTRHNSSEPIHIWDDLPNIEYADPVSTYARDVAYSAQYWWVWDGFWNAAEGRFDRVGINDIVTIAQGLKMNDRLGQLVKGDTNFIKDATEGLWWKTYYAHANLELADALTPEFLATWRADDILKRGEGLYNLVRVIIDRNLYDPADVASIKAFLDGNDTAFLTHSY